MTLFGVSSLSFLGVSLGEITKKLSSEPTFGNLNIIKHERWRQLRGFMGKSRGLRASQMVIKAYGLYLVCHLLPLSQRKIKKNKYIFGLLAGLQKNIWK